MVSEVGDPWMVTKGEVVLPEGHSEMREAAW
jgi:hypothetical protein